MNANAGKLKLTAGPDEMRRMAGEVGLDCEIVETKSEDEMHATLDRLVAAGVGRVAVAGGDGTVNAAVQHLAKTNTALGIIPQGTANNFANALRLPLDLPSALRVLREGKVQEVDLGFAHGKYFTEAAGVGLFADALTLYGGSNKNPFKGLYTMFRLLLSLRASRIRLTVDGKVVGERAVMCTVANTFRMANALPVAPEARITDGLLDIVILGDLTRLEIWSYYRAFRAQTHLGLPKVNSMRAKEVRIEARRRMAVHVDDKVIGVTPVTITTQPGALKVLVDRL
jgi:YegS/Rv2252/BmrU family lipid kinase